MHVELERRLEKLDKKEKNEEELHNLKKTEMSLKIKIAEIDLEKAKLELKQAKQISDIQQQKIAAELQF